MASGSASHKPDEPSMSVKRKLTTPEGRSPAAATAGPWSPDRGSEGGILGQNGLLELAQALAGLDPELLDQGAARVLVGLQRVRLAIAAVERKHQLRPQALSIGMLVDQRFELGDHLGVAAKGELGFHQLLERADAQVLET